MVTYCILDRAELIPMEAEQYRCPECGTWYTADLLRMADPEVWERITAQRLYCLECDQALPGLPRLHINAQGEPIPCPTHDPRARRSWWRRILRLG